MGDGRLGRRRFFILNLFAMIGTVIVSSFGTRWLGTWLPAGWTTRWYSSAWAEFQLGDILIVSFQVVGLVVLISGILGVTAAYALARREFPGKRLVMLLFLLPLLIPPITFGIPLATVLYQAGLAGTFWGVVAANLVPTVPFVILVMIPFIEQIDPKIEAAARVFGATRSSCSSTCCCRCCCPASSRRCCWCSCARSRCSS